MINCDNCIHYEACDFHFNLKEYPPEQCTLFKDKSRLAKIPCNLYDTVYTIPRRAIRKWRVVFIGLCESPYINIAWYKDRNNFETRSIYFEQIGKTVFLTKEEAEANLKELNEK